MARQVGGVRADFHGKPDGPLFELHDRSRARPDLHGRIYDLGHRRQRRRGNRGGGAESPYADRVNIYNDISDLGALLLG